MMYFLTPHPYRRWRIEPNQRWRIGGCQAAGWCSFFRGREVSPDIAGNSRRKRIVEDGEPDRHVAVGVAGRGSGPKLDEEKNMTRLGKAVAALIAGVSILFGAG